MTPRTPHFKVADRGDGEEHCRQFITPPPIASVRNLTMGGLEGQWSSSEGKQSKPPSDPGLLPGTASAKRVGAEPPNDHLARNLV